MKLAKFLLNFLLWCVTFVIMIFGQYGVTALYSWQAGGNVERVHITASDTEVSYLDVPQFMIDDLKVGYQQEDYYLVRNWFKAEWWKTGTKWLDVGLSKIVVTFKGIFLPIGDIKDLKEKHIDGWSDEYEYYSNYYLVMEMPEFKEYWGIDPNFDFEDIAERCNPMHEEYDEKYLTYFEAYNACNVEINPNIMTETQWIDEYSHAYKFIRIANHYNSPEMQRYYNKFINEDGNIKFAAIAVYSHLLIALIFASWFVHNNKFRLKRNDDGENEVEGGFKMPGFRRKKKDKKNKKNKDQ